MESPHKFKNLVGTIESLLGSKSDLTVTWAQSVKLIIEDLSTSCPSTPCTPYFPQNYTHNDNSSLEGELILLKAAYALSNVNRKLALNKLLDLKGNIRVFCRVRPLERGNGIVTTDIPNQVRICSSLRKLKNYTFDKVFQPASLQDDVFSEVEPIVRSALDGSNVCIFAYGQTGTGKTFTMEGSQECPGIVPRTLQQIFFDSSLDTTVEYSFKLSMLEVYRGNLRDLLAPRENNKSLNIQMAGSGRTEIENLTEVPINNASQARYLYGKGIRSRSTCWTTANETSSRSHCLVRINITCNYGKHKHVSKLWLVDLGGSERFSKTQAQGQTLEEGKAINSSLTALGDVISALQRKQPHIPYRNSKLTQILRDCLGKDSKALMLVHVSPREEDVGETLCSLGFASRARAIHLGKDLSSSAMDERNAAMAEVVTKMKTYENECQKLNTNIQTLESLVQTKGGQLDKDLVQVKLESTADSQRVDTEYSSSVPRFMTPTLSSQRKARSVSVHVEKRTEGRQVRRTLNFEVEQVSKVRVDEVLQVDGVNKGKREEVVKGKGDVQPKHVKPRRLIKGLGDKANSGWEEFGKNGKCRRRWMFECSSKISITKRL